MNKQERAIQTAIVFHRHIHHDPLARAPESGPICEFHESNAERGHEMLFSPGSAAGSLTNEGHCPWRGMMFYFPPGNTVIVSLGAVLLKASEGRWTKRKMLTRQKSDGKSFFCFGLRHMWMYL